MVKRTKRNIQRKYKRSLKGGAGRFWEDYKRAHKNLEKQKDLLYSARDQYNIVLRDLLIRKYPKKYEFLMNIRANSLANKAIIEFNNSRLNYNKEALDEHHGEEDELKSYLIDGKLKRLSHKDAGKKQVLWMIGKASDTIRSPKKIFSCFKSLFWHFAHALLIKMFFTAGSSFIHTGDFMGDGPWITWSETVSNSATTS